MQNKLVLVLIVLCLGFASCDSGSVFDQYKSVPNQWNKDSIVTFKVQPPDSVNAYNVFVNLPNEIVLQKESLEISVLFSIMGVVFAASALTLSFVWHRLPQILIFSEVWWSFQGYYNHSTIQFCTKIKQFINPEDCQIRSLGLFNI